MNILITICARGGSKGIPNKNIKLLNGKPLIAYTIAHAQAFANLFPADISLSTDSESIKEVAENFDVFTKYTRPAELATDTAGKIPVINHLVAFEQTTRQKQYDLVLDLDVSAPLRTIHDLVNAYQLIVANGAAYNLFSVSKAHKNPYFNMVEINEAGFADLCKKAANGQVESRQTAPQVYELNASFYFYKKAFFTSGQMGAITNKSIIYTMQHICFDLDEMVDFAFLDFLLKENALGWAL